MDPVSISIIVLISLNIVTFLVSPLVIAGGIFIKRISKSDCCGGHLELNNNSQEDGQKQDAPKQIPIETIKEIIKK